MKLAAIAVRFVAANFMIVGVGVRVGVGDGAGAGGGQVGRERVVKVVVSGAVASAGRRRRAARSA